MIEPILIDFETRSPLDLKKVGIYRYIEDPRTHILCFAASYNGFRNVFYDPKEIPDWLFYALADDSVPVHAHNATVERLIIQRICTPEHGWPRVKTRRFRCSAARARRLALPGSLDKLGDALGLHTKKDKDGTLVMRRLSRPIKQDPVQGFIYDNDPEKLLRLGAYCMRDVETEEAAEAATFPMPESEERYYQLTERINDRGVAVDVKLVRRLIWRANEATHELNARLREITRGAVTALTQVAQLKKWVEDETGVTLQTLRKEDMDGLLQEAGPYGFSDHVTEALKIRQEGAKSSVAKLLAILDRVSSDGRVHGAFVFNGASTGRYTSMGVQLQNLIRDVLKDFDKRIAELDEFTLSEISRCIRACFIPADGCVFIDADYNAIEARGVGWLAGAKKLVRIYETGGDPYCEMGTVIYRFPVTKANEKERFVGKQTILGCGYGMGALKFEAQCEKFGQPVPFETAQRAIDAYRSEYPEIPELWQDMERAAIAAVKHPGKRSQAADGKISYLFKDGYLQMKLPNGRRLFYKAPRIDMEEKFGRLRPCLSYMATDGKTKQWWRERTWGGKLTENAVQALCRDLLFEAMDRIELRGVAIVLSVHDQLVCEVLECDKQWALKVVKEEMERVPDWARGFPVTAEPKVTLRFGK
jgi:DNA polymerase